MIDHVILTVSDFERSVAFYVKALRACLKTPDFERLPAKGSAGASPYRGVFGRARLLPSQRAKKMRVFKQALRPLGITNFIDYEGKHGHPDLKRLW